MVDRSDQVVEELGFLRPRLEEPEDVLAVALGRFESLGACRGLRRAQPHLAEGKFRVEIDGLPNERIGVVEVPVNLALLAQRLGQLQEVRRELGGEEARRPRHHRLGTPYGVHPEASGLLHPLCSTCGALAICERHHPVAELTLCNVRCAEPTPRHRKHHRPVRGRVGKTTPTTSVTAARRHLSQAPPHRP